MTKIQFYPMDFDYEEGTVKIYGKTIDNRKICVIDDSIKPYFWVVVDKGNVYEIEKILDNIELSEDDKTFRVIKTEILNKSYFDKGIEAIKVSVDSQDAIKLISKKIEGEFKVCETDIKLIKKYLTEKDVVPLALSDVEGEIIKENTFEICIKGQLIQSNSEFLENPKVLCFDIEVETSFVKDKLMEKHPIFSIAFFSENFRKVITWKKFKAENYVEFVDSEQDLINRFKDVINEFKPDYLIGYFSDGFDLPYIKARADIHNIKLDLGVDKSVINVKKRENSHTVKIKGIPHLDIFKFIKNIMSGSLQLDSYNLNEVSRELLKEEKKDFDLNELDEMWINGKNLHELMEYNLKDAELTYKLFLKIMPNMNELVKLTGMPIFDVCRASYGQLVENYLIKRSKEFNEIIPNKPTFTKMFERMLNTYKGAFVMEPTPGLYNNLVVFDFKSLYPTIIITKNISPSMLNYERGYKTPEIIDENGKKLNYLFDYKKEAFIPKVIEDLIIRRNRVKEILKKEKSKILEARSYALKTVANSTYGYFGFSGSRYYSKECAESITAFAREHIQDVIKKAILKKFDVIYSDTDAVCINLKDKTKEQALEFLDEINKELPSLMELELESFYLRGIFVSKKGESQGAKKKYALIDEKGNIKIRGFETVRRDWSLIARETQKKVLETILKEGSHENALKYVKEVISKIKNKEIQLKHMTIITQLKLKLEDYKLIGPHVAIAKRMKEKGIEIKPGSSISFIVTELPGLIRDKARLPEESENYDSEYYINNQVIPSVEKIFEIFGVKKEDLLEKEQSKLDQF